MRGLHLKTISQTVKLALPIALARVLEVSMGTVDTIMVGHLGKDALASVGIALPLWNFLAVFFMGTLHALTPLLGQSLRQKSIDDEENALLAAKGLVFIFLGLTAVTFLISGFLFTALSQPADLIQSASYFLIALFVGVPAVLLNQVLRQMFEVHKKPRITVMISIIGFLLNILGNYCLIYGRLGFPALGIYGSALSTALCWWWMFAAHLTCLKFIDVSVRAKHILFSTALPKMSAVVAFAKQGMPLGAGTASEVGFFVLTAWMVGQIGKVPLASHHIAINLASITFMFAIGTSNATTVLVSQTHGVFKKARIYMYGISGSVIISLFMLLTAILFISFPNVFVGLYTKDSELLAFVPKLLWLAGAFQVFDGLQAVGFGILRGIGAGKTAFKNTMIAFWLMGAPIGMLLGKFLTYGAQGYWVGLTVGLGAAAFFHLRSFKKYLSTSILTGI